MSGGQTSLFGWGYLNPITDIQFVCSLDKVPYGYVALQQCANGCDAQLWENEPGKPLEARYICYTKENVSRDHVIDGMYIPSPDQTLLRKDYQIIVFTMEGRKTLKKQYLAVKKVPISNASKYIVEISAIPVDDRGRLPKSYKRLPEVNGLHILYREAPPPIKAAYSSSSSSSHLGPSSADTIPKGPPLMSSTLLPDPDHEATVRDNLPPPRPPPRAIPFTAEEQARQLAVQKKPLRHLRLKEGGQRKRYHEYDKKNGITDIVFVCSLDNVPPGYTVIQKCPSGHSAQLWDSQKAGHPSTRYLCYTKDNRDDGLVVEKLYIPWPGESLMRKGFKAIRHTVEGEEPMYEQHLLVQKVPLSQASRVVVDIIICRQKEIRCVPSSYNKLTEANELRITFRTAPNIYYDPKVLPPQVMATNATPDIVSNQLVQPPSNQIQSMEMAGSSPVEQLYLKEILVHPITDIVIVCSLENVPRGYTGLHSCASTYSAQLWRRGRFQGRSETRYLCFTKDPQSDDRLVEDIQVLHISERPPNGYEVIKSTVEGERPLKNKQIAVRKVPRVTAKAMVIDIIMCRKKERELVAREYTTLRGINDICIGYMVAHTKDLIRKR